MSKTTYILNLCEFCSTLTRQLTFRAKANHRIYVEVEGAVDLSEDDKG